VCSHIFWCEYMSLACVCKFLLCVRTQVSLSLQKKIVLVCIQDYFVLMCVTHMNESWQTESWNMYEVFLCLCISPIRMYG